MGGVDAPQRVLLDALMSAVGDGQVTAADRETLDAEFRDKALAEMTRPGRRPELRPMVIELTGLDPAGCIERVARALSLSEIGLAL